MKPKAIIFDLDGTICDITHRLHFIDGTDGKKDYKAFYEALVDDSPKEDIIALLYLTISGSHTENLFVDAYDFPTILFCSGRPNEYREITKDWFEGNVGGLAVNDDHLFMRPTGDYRPDYIVKEEMLREIEKTYDVLFTVDDRQQVVDMWRRNGITCLQVEQWAEHKKPKVEIEPGVLTLLVGPSGAGKSTYLEDDLGDYNNLVISSDGLRHRFTGDFKDQSMNDEVWTTIHSLIEANIKLGINVTLDATNIKNANRKAILDLVPESTLITYIVIDRPLNQKIKTGGWRNDVMVKGLSLIQYHHNVMQSNLSAILAGDNDPRVTVYDMRRT